MNKAISILLTDDHPILLKGLHQEFINHGYTQVYTANNGMEALNFIVKNEPKIAILDIEMPILTGFEVIIKAKELGLNTKFIILSYHKEKGFIVQAKKIGIEGYLVKDDQFSEIENCIHTILNNKSYISSSFNDNFLKEVNQQTQAIQHLTPSERTILRLIANNLNSNQIAEKLKISVRTVHKHRTNIISKLELEQNKDALSNWANTYKTLILSL